MSNDKNAKAPALTGSTQSAVLEPVRIKHVRFVTKGVMVTTGKEALDHMPARTSNKVQGYDIHYYRDRGEFLFVNHIDGGPYTRWMDRTRIENYEVWPPDDQPSSAA
jgi:hypothetical protein